MLEIVVLVSMCRYVNRVAAAKGRPGWPFILLMVFGWFAGGIAGAVVGFLVSGDFRSQFSLGAVVGYAMGVALACVLNALIVNALSPLADQYELEAVDEEETYIRWRKRREPKPERGRLVDDDEDEVVELEDARGRPWKRKWSDGG